MRKKATFVRKQFKTNIMKKLCPNKNQQGEGLAKNLQKVLPSFHTLAHTKLHL